MKGLAKIIVKLKWIIILVVAGLTVFFGLQLGNIKVNSDILSTLPDDDDTGVLYKNIGKQFGGNEIGMIVLETDDVFTWEVLDHVRQVTDLPVVVLTTSEAEDDILNAYTLHANCYITKPVDFLQFTDIVKQIEGFWLQLVKLPHRR